ncbi:VWA domain-containing protein [Chloroflexota bacterium]
MSFIWPFMLFSLLLIPVLIGLYFRLLQRRRQAVAALGPLGMVQNSTGRELGQRRHLPPLLFLFGLTLLLLGLARPEMIVNLPRIEGTVILAFDVSSSMMADDLEPTRIEAAKAAAQAFVENQPSTIMIGVVAFSNGGLVVQPPTNDQAAVLTTIERLSPEGGTSLGHGIFTSLNAIAGEAISIDVPSNDEASDDDSAPEASGQPIQIGDYSSAVILLLSDGENTGPPDPMEVAQVAAEAGVRIYPVGIGSPQGTVLQIDGFNILTQLNETTLQEIASLTNGFYYRAEDEESLQEIYENIDVQLTITGEKMEVTSIVAGVSLLLLLIGGALSLLWFGRVP